MSAPPKTSWLDDPHLARRLARYTWVALVGVFVIATRFEFASAERSALLGALIAVAMLLNAPVVLGLWRSRAESHTRLYRFVAFALLLRAASVVWVVWIVSSLAR